jgi:hypothetical protein
LTVYGEIITNISNPEEISGQVLVNLSGEIVGYRIKKDKSYIFVASNILSESLVSYYEALKKVGKLEN